MTEQEPRIVKCSVASCGKTLPTSPKDQPPLCPECLYFMERFIYFATHIKIERGRSAYGLITPGHQEFKTTLDGQEIPQKKE